MFNVKWGYTCYECQCPLEVDLIIKDPNLELFFRDFSTWGYLRPFSLYQNLVMYKFYDLVVKRVCLSCYYHPNRVNLINREVGFKKVSNKNQIIKSKSCKEIYDYFNNFIEFRQRKDLEICIVEEEKRTNILGLKILWDPPPTY